MQHGEKGDGGRLLSPQTPGLFRQRSQFLACLDPGCCVKRLKHILVYFRVTALISSLFLHSSCKFVSSLAHLLLLPLFLSFLLMCSVQRPRRQTRGLMGVYNMAILRSFIDRLQFCSPDVHQDFRWFWRNTPPLPLTLRNSTELRSTKGAFS